MGGLFVPGHVAKQVRRERVQPKAEDAAATEDSGQIALHKDNTLTPEQVQLAIRRWDVDPIGQRVFVAPMPRDKSAGGIIMSQVDAAMSWDGVVIASGPLAFVHRNIPDKDWGAAKYAEIEEISAYRLCPGDKVTFAKWSGEEMKRWWLDAPALKIMNADDVLGLVKEDKA